MPLIALRHPEHGHNLVRPDDLHLSHQSINQSLGLSGLVATEYLVYVGDDVGQLGGFGHGGFALKFFGQLVAPLPELPDLGGELVQPWRGGLLGHGAVLERGEVPLDGCVGLGQFAADYVVFGDAFGVACGVERACVRDRLRDQIRVVGVEIAHRRQDGSVGVIGVQPGRGALLGAVAGTGEARVVAVRLGPALGGGADHRLVAVGAPDLAGEQVVRTVGRAVAVALTPSGKNPLCLFESSHVDDGFVGVEDDYLAEDDLPDVDAIDQHPQHLLRGPRPTDHRPMPACVEPVGDLAGTDPIVGIAGEDRADDRRLIGHDLQHGGVRVWRVSGRSRATGPASTCGFAFHPVDHPIDDHFAFELGEHAQQLQQQPTHRGGGIDRLGRRPERHPRR
ncbi:MAG TPA: hypothetical protein VFX16_03910 [Pseudonocardiaceae bacterium]|nr:hypothetical protein [Pseudonocardiaceae bacterium]